MWKWLRRLAGGIISTLSLWKVVDLLWSVPGRLNDLEVWEEWIKKVSASEAIYPIGIVGGVLIAISEWWWPRVSIWVKHMKSKQRRKEVETPSLPVATDDWQSKRFKELEPLITRHRKAVEPIRHIFAAVHLRDFEWKLGFDADREELMAKVDVLRIPHPSDEADRRVWFNYLVRLEAACHNGDLEEARSLYQSDSEAELQDG